MLAKTIVFIFFAADKVLPQCTPRNLRFVGFQKEPRRSVPFTVQVIAHKCPRFHNFYYKWEIRESNGSKVFLVASSPTFHVNGYSIAFEECFEKEFILSVQISHYKNMKLFSEISKPFHFVPDEMHLEIVGGIMKTHSRGADLILDGKSLFRDTSYSPKEDSIKGNKIRWVAPLRVKGQEVEPLVLKVTGDLLKLGKRYNFTLTVTRTRIRRYLDQKSVSQMVTIVKSSEPQLSIKCLRNCINSHPQETTILEVICMKNCRELNYEWTMTPTVNVNKTKLVYSSNKLLILNGSFHFGDNVKVKARQKTESNSTAFSVVSVNFVDKINEGTCDVTPKQGESGKTKFRVFCWGFSSAFGPLLYMIYQDNDAVPGGVLLSVGASPEENEIYFSEGSPAIITVIIQDTAFVQTEVKLKVDVKPFKARINNSTVYAIKRLILTQHFDSLFSLVSENRRNQVVQLVSLLLDALKTLPDEAYISSVYVSKKILHKRMARALLELDTFDLPSVTQIISLSMKIQGYKSDADSETTRLVSRLLRNAMLGLKDIIKKKESNIPFSILYELGKNVLLLCSNLVAETTELNFSLLKKVEAIDYESYDDMLSEKVRIRVDMQEVISNVIISIKIIGASVLTYSIPDQEPVTFDVGSVAFTTRRITPDFLPRETVTLPDATDSFVTFSEMLAEEVKREHQFVDYQFATFKDVNPFWWYRSKFRLNTNFILFDLFQEWSRFSTIENPFYISLKTNTIPLGVLKGNLTDRKPIQVHRIEIQRGELLVVTFQVHNETFTVAHCFCYCKDQDFYRGLQISPEMNEEQRTLRITQKKSKKAVYICVKKTGETPLQYVANFATFSCVYWNTKNAEWQSNDCAVHRATLTNGSEMVCKCKHASFFGGEIFVPPNQENNNFLIDFYITFVTNWVPVYTLAAVYVIWAIAVIIARHWDKKLKKKNVIAVLDDNMPGDQHVYLMVIYTGMFYDAGTTADVVFQVIGSESCSRVHLIKSSGIKMLQRNAQDWMIFYTPRLLGKIRKIRLWHNCKGEKPHWYCRRILIMHVKSGYQECFKVRKWFSLIWGAGKIYREIRPASRREMRSFKLILAIKMETSLVDRHLWLSIVARDPQSNFSSVERISVYFVFLFISLLASALFYKIPDDSPKDSIDEGTIFFINKRKIIVILESCALSIPVMWLLTFMFRSSRPKREIKIRQ